MDSADDQHLFDLIINPVIYAANGIAIPVAFVLSGMAIFAGKLLFIFPAAVLLLLAALASSLVIGRLIAANFTKKPYRSWHRLETGLLTLTLVLSIGVILAAVLSGVVTFGAVDIERVIPSSEMPAEVSLTRLLRVY